MPVDADRYLFCAGLLRAQRLVDQADADIVEGMLVNALGVIRECDQVLGGNPRARICVIGSESGFSWSYDGAYAAAKAVVHRYVEAKSLAWPDQQLVCVAPTIIGDASMTMVRHDLDDVRRRGEAHPKGRWLEATEVAAMVHHLLYVDRGYTTGTVVRMHGGGGR